MTQEQKQIIINGINNNESIASLARKLSIGESTIRMFIKRNIDKTDDTLCKNCGKPISSLPHHKTKVFCSDKCRMQYWLKHQKERKCKCCSNLFTPNSRSNQFFCSRECYLKYVKNGGGSDES